MSLNELILDRFKPGLSIRVDNLTVDGVLTYNEMNPVNPGPSSRYLNEGAGFKDLALADLQPMGSETNNGVLINNGGNVYFQEGQIIANGTMDGQVPIWTVSENAYVPGFVSGGGNVLNGTAANQIPFWNDIDNVYEPREFPENVENGFAQGQIPVWDFEAGKYLPASGVGVEPGSRNQQVFLWSVGQAKGYWGDLSTTPDFSIDTSGFGTQYGLNFIKSTPTNTTLTGVSNSNSVAVSTSSNGSIQGNCLDVSIANSVNSTIGRYANYCNIDSSVGGTNGTNGNIYNSDNTPTNASTACKIVSSNNARVAKGSYSSVDSALGVDGVNTLENTTYCNVTAVSSCGITNGTNNTVSASSRSRVLNSVRCSVYNAGNTTNDVILQNSTNVAAFGFTNWTSPSGLTNKVLGGLTSVQWCLHNDNGVLDIKSVNTAGTFPSGQSRYMDSEIELECGRLVRVNDDLSVEYAHDNEFAFGVVRHPDSAPLKFNACKSGMHKVTDLWGKHLKDSEGNYLEEYIECKERSLIETHGEYIVQSKDNKLRPGAYVVSDPNGFAKMSGNDGRVITNMKVFGRINSDDDSLIKNDTFAYRCYINPTF